MNIADHYGLWIAGDFRPAENGETLPVESPATGQVLCSVARGQTADVDRAVEAANKAAGEWGQTSGTARAKILRRAAALLTERMGELVDLEVSQTGRAVREMTAQLQRLPEWYDYFAALAETHESPVPPFGTTHLNYTRRRPLGVVGLVTPWNHPLLILTKKVAPALAAGNTAVVKPSELAPVSALMLGEILAEAGLPPGGYNVVTGYGAEAGAALSDHPGLAKIDLTGGTDTGKRVAAAAGTHLAAFSGELGGKANVVIFEDIDLDRAVAAALFAGFIASGQTCVQGARVLVQADRVDEFSRRLAQRAGEIVVGDPTDPATQMGSMVSAAQRDRTEQYVRIAEEEGARLLTGGQSLTVPGHEAGYFYAPTVFDNVENGMRIAQEEVFGPVICVLPFTSESDAIRLANATRYGLATSVWTTSVARAHRVAHQLDIGVVWINDHHRIGPASPWGGSKESGLGRENGQVAYESYTQLQNIMVNLTDDSFDWFIGDVSGLRYS